RFDPAQRIVRADYAVFDVVFLNSFAEGLLAQLRNAVAILGVRTGSPFAARGYHRPLWQAVQRGIAFGNMDQVSVKTIGVAADQGRLSGQRKLQVALGKGVFGALAIGNVSRQALDAQQPALLVKLGFCGLLQPYLAAIGATKPETQGVKRIVRAQSTDRGLEALAIFGMDPREELRNCPETLIDDKCGIVAAP